MHKAYAAPWAIEVPDEAQLRKVLGGDSNTRVLLFHFVRKGKFELRMGGVAPVSIGASHVAICPTGAAHVMSRGRGAKPVPIEAILRGKSAFESSADSSDVTELVCGAFLARAAPLNPMLGALPPVMTVATADVAFSPMLAGVAWMLAHEIDRNALGGLTCARLLELFCVEAIRAYQRSNAGEQPGWFKGLADPKISQAIRQVHASPGHDWTVDALATSVALSASRFAARFRETTGQSVMNYVARWRANVACRMLRDTTLGVTQIAHRVGYTSLPAFSRAFKAQVGQAPAAWRAAGSHRRGRAQLPEPGGRAFP